MNTSETAEDSPEKKPAGWRETYSFLMQHFTAPCLGSTNVDLVYLREIERLVEQASAVDIHMPDVADAQEIIRMWNIEARQHVRLLVNMMQIQLSSVQTLEPGLGKEAEVEIARLKQKYGV